MLDDLLVHPQQLGFAHRGGNSGGRLSRLRSQRGLASLFQLEQKVIHGQLVAFSVTGLQFRDPCRNLAVVQKLLRLSVDGVGFIFPAL